MGKKKQTKKGKKVRKIKVDVAVIGAGTAGLNARRAAEKLGASTVIVDKGPLGTTCARVGCMPSKLLIAASDAAHHIDQAKYFGLNASLRVNGAKVLERVKKERNRFVGSVLKSTQALQRRGKLIKGKVRFLDSHTFAVGSVTIQAKTIILATGTSPKIPKDYQPFKHRILTNESFFEQKRLPKSVLVVGTGLIGLEIGQALHRLGVKVTILGRRQAAGPIHDPVVLKRAIQVFSSQLDFYPGHKLERIAETTKGVRIRFRDKHRKVHSGIFERILIAAGRESNLDHKEMNRIGVPLDRKGYFKVDQRTMQIPGSHFYFAGDVNGSRQVLHEAAYEGEIAGTNAAHFPYTKEYVRNTPLVIVFTDPQIAVVGKAWEGLNSKKISIGEVDYSKQGRAQIMCVNEGIVRVYGDNRRRTLLGAEMLGPRMEHMAHLVAWAIEQKMTVDKLLQMPFYHPVLEEGLHTALSNLVSRLNKKQKRRKP